MSGRKDYRREAYSEIKVRIFARDLRPGQYLKAAQLALEFGLSATPVREALLRLATEELVAERSGGGFFVPYWDPQIVRDLYQLAKLQILATSLLTPDQRRLEGIRPDWLMDELLAWNDGDSGPPGSPERARRFFHYVIRRGGNTVQQQWLQRLDERLTVIRLAELEWLGPDERELNDLVGSYADADWQRFDVATRRYFNRRISKADELSDYANR